MRNVIFALAVFAVSPAVFAQQSGARDPIIAGGTTQKLSDHVFVIPDQNVGGVPNVGIIVGSRAALVVDTGIGVQNGRTVLAEAQKAAPGKTLYLVTTHVHPEHDLGASAFPATTKMIRSNDQVKDIPITGVKTAESFAGRSPVMAELLKGYAFRKADITFDKDYNLDLGGFTVRLIAMGANHTPGDTAIWIPADRVLFSGDIAMKGGPNFATADAHVTHWLASLNQFDALKPSIVVPSHGPVGDASFMAGYRAYFTAIRDATFAAKKRGESVDEAVKSVGALLGAQFPEAGGRMLNVIRAAYAEAP